MLKHILKFFLIKRDPYILVEEDFLRAKTKGKKFNLNDFAFKFNCLIIKCDIDNGAFAPKMYYSARKDILDNPSKYPDDVVERAKNLSIKDIDDAVKRYNSRTSSSSSSHSRSRSRSRGRSSRRSSGSCPSNHDILF